MTDISEIKSLVETGNRAVEAFKSELNTELKSVKDMAAKLRGDVDGLAGEKLAKIDGEINTLAKSLNELVAKSQRPQFGPDGEVKTEAQIAYAKAFNQWFRKGYEAADMRELEAKAMSIGSDPDGGYTVTPEIDAAILDVVKQISPMRSLASVMTVGSSSWKKRVNQRGTASGWVGETESRSGTANSTFSEIEIPVHEIYAMPSATQSVLDDSAISLESWIAGEVQTEFAYQEGVAFISGDGVKKPRGLISGYSPIANGSYTWGRPGFVGTGTSGAFSAAPGDDIVALVHALKTEYRQRPGTGFIMNTATMSAVRKIKDASGQYYLVSADFTTDGAVQRLMGYPVTEMVAMDDIGANSYSIAFGNFAEAYQIVDRMGVRVLRDPYSSKPYVLFYTTKRVGGGVKNFEAYKLLKFA